MRSSNTQTGSVQFVEHILHRSNDPPDPLDFFFAHSLPRSTADM